MSALTIFGERQQALLNALLHSGKGLTVDELSRELDISRNAVNQHIASLEGDGYIQNSLLSSTGGRPSRIYTLSPSGQELFPRHYSLIANLMIHWVMQKRGAKELKTCLTDLGHQLAHEFDSRMEKQKNFADRVNEVILIMRELGYEAQGIKSGKNYSEIKAINCVFHEIAKECNEVCELDLSLLSTLLNADIEHKECMVKGGQCCQFAIKRR